MFRLMLLRLAQMPPGGVKPRKPGICPAAEAAGLLMVTAQTSWTQLMIGIHGDRAATRNPRGCRTLDEPRRLSWQSVTVAHHCSTDMSTTTHVDSGNVTCLLAGTLAGREAMR